MADKQLPSKYRQIQVNSLGTDFRKVTTIVEKDLPTPGANEVLIRNKFVGINASDINFTAGRYNFGAETLPFTCGFEGIGEVVKAGAESPVKVGQLAVHLKKGAFAEYVIVPAAEVIPVPSDDPALMSIALSGLTASISLEKEADLKAGKTVLVTAAAGGTGQFAVQLAKAAGCHVVGTCSTDEKVQFLKSIGCDRPINYKKESLDEVLRKEYPKGIDVVYESIGKEIFEAALKNLAIKGRMIIIGIISSYQEGLKDETTVNSPRALLVKSASIRGFFLLHYVEEFQRHVGMLTKMYLEGKLKVAIEKGPKEKPFKGLESVSDAIDCMFAGKNVGKVVVAIEHVKSS